MIAPQARARNRAHLLKALAHGLEVTGVPGQGSYQVESEREPGKRYRVFRQVCGLWFCRCRWAEEHFADGYDPHSNCRPCKHMLLCIAYELPVKVQDIIVRRDPEFREAVERGVQARNSCRLEWAQAPQSHVTACDWTPAQATNWLAGEDEPQVEESYSDEEEAAAAASPLQLAVVAEAQRIIRYARRHDQPPAGVATSGVIEHRPGDAVPMPESFRRQVEELWGPR